MEVEFQQTKFQNIDRVNVIWSKYKVLPPNLKLVLLGLIIIFIPNIRWRSRKNSLTVYVCFSLSNKSGCLKYVETFVILDS